MLLTGAWPEIYEKAEMSHFEMMCEIAETLSAWNPACFIGQNLVSFDDEMLRHGLFASLLPPYLTSGAGCSRADTLTMLKAFAVHSPGSITLPVINGKISMRLGNVARANGIKVNGEHDALGDVKTTIELARLMKSRNPALFDQLLALGSRINVSTLIADHALFRLSSWYGEPRTITVASIAVNISNRNQHALLNLDYDPECLFQLTSEELCQLLWSKGGPIEIIRLNACPILMPLDTMDFASSENGTDFYTMMARATAIKLNIAFQARVGEAMAFRGAQWPISPNIEEQLYSGSFPTWRDKNACRRFVDRKTSWEERRDIAHHLKDDRLRVHAYRILFTEQPACLPADINEAMFGWFAEKLLGTDVPWRTIHDACLEIASLRDGLQDQIDHDPQHDGEAEFARLDDLEMYMLTLASGLK